MKALTDDELRNELKANGIEPGPLTPSTREVYERKLQRILDGGKSCPRNRPTVHPSPAAGTESLKVEEISVRPAPRISIGRTAIVNPTIFAPPASTYVSNYRDRTLNESQENPGHTPTSGLRSPLKPVNGDDIYSSTPSGELDPHYRPNSSLSTHQSRGPYSSTPRQSLSRNEMDTPSSQSRDRSFWASWFQPANINSGVMSDESNLNTEEIVHRASNSYTFHPRREGETIDRSFSARILGHSIGNQVPNVILFCGITLIIVIASSYLLLKDKHSNVGKIADIQKIVCPTMDNAGHSVSAEVGSRQCLSSQDLPTVLKIAHTLFDILSRFAGEHICGDSVESTRMEIRTAKRLVENAVTSLSSESLSFYQVDLSFHDVNELESLRPYIPGKCRLRILFTSILHFLQNLLWLIVILTAVGCFCYVVYRAKQSQLNRAKRRSKRVQEIVREVSCILQQQIERSQANRSEAPHVPVTVLKAKLRQTNSDLEDLWSDVERYVHLVERNIAVGDWRGLGETWQWHAGSGWQGSAVSDHSQRLPFKEPPTQCLKIRNMFKADSPDVNPLRLKRELLHRVNGCGDILHIGLDSSEEQGLVYIKCASPAVAGRVFGAINANYFDGHMLTVKFLRPARYHSRFPDAININVPLNVGDLE
ncbi:unnamed protein product [Rodentolepis nana]|uniref:LEM domain-containing protein n=1 Tax=Rodentolepis nana TaxID=102285 RepID=A0A0R3TKM4_RODNA|nr:unnamed protein product [Rodentolepis nana]